jgi:hypothetical protein
MAHFAKVENGIVTEVIVVNNETLGNLEFPDSESVGQEFISSLGLDGTWKQTSYNNNFRGKYAGIGDTWTGKTFKSPEIITQNDGVE